MGGGGGGGGDWNKNAPTSHCPRKVRQPEMFLVVKYLLSPAQFSCRKILKIGTLVVYLFTIFES